MFQRNHIDLGEKQSSSLDTLRTKKSLLLHNKRLWSVLQNKGTNLTIENDYFPSVSQSYFRARFISLETPQLESCVVSFFFSLSNKVKINDYYYINSGLVPKCAIFLSSMQPNESKLKKSQERPKKLILEQWDMYDPRSENHCLALDCYKEGWICRASKAKAGYMLLKDCSCSTKHNKYHPIKPERWWWHKLPSASVNIITINPKWSVQSYLTCNSKSPSRSVNPDLLNSWLLWVERETDLFPAHSPCCFKHWCALEINFPVFHSLCLALNCRHR